MTSPPRRGCGRTAARPCGSRRSPRPPAPPTHWTSTAWDGGSTPASRAASTSSGPPSRVTTSPASTSEARGSGVGHRVHGDERLVREARAAEVGHPATIPGLSRARARTGRWPPSPRRAAVEVAAEHDVGDAGPRQVLGEAGTSLAGRQPGARPRPAPAPSGRRDHRHLAPGHPGGVRPAPGSARRWSIPRSAARSRRRARPGPGCPAGRRGSPRPATTPRGTSVHPGIRRPLVNSGAAPTSEDAPPGRRPATRRATGRCRRRQPRRSRTRCTRSTTQRRGMGDPSARGSRTRGSTLCTLRSGASGPSSSARTGSSTSEPASDGLPTVRQEQAQHERERERAAGAACARAADRRARTPRPPWRGRRATPEVTSRRAPGHQS